MAIAEAPRIQTIFDKVYRASVPDPKRFILKTNPLNNNGFGIRPRSATVEGGGFGDEAKGHVTQEVNATLSEQSPSGELYAVRYNGTRNAGHEVYVQNGNEYVAVTLHQLPVAVTQEGTTSILGKGMLIHPLDLRTEVSYAEDRLGAALPGNFIIDNNAILTTDLHSASESFVNSELGITGSTASGVSEGYSSWLQKRALTVRDFTKDDWRNKFTQQYNLYSKQLGEEQLAQTLVNVLTKGGKRRKKPVGTLPEYLDELEDVRPFILAHAADVRPILEDVWRNRLDIPVTLEGAQGGLLDPQFGVYPDVTASRPLGRVGIPDSTEGVILYDQIAFPTAVMKQPYMSSVGSRIPPYEMAPDIANMYRMENDETGRSTGRDRGIYPIDIAAMRAIQRIAGYRYLVVTHLDSNHPDTPIEVVTHYVNKQTGQEEQYRPYQWHWDQVVGVVQRLPSWDGKAVANATRIEDFPPECLQFLRFLSKTIAPVAMVTNGPRLGQRISFLP